MKMFMLVMAILQGPTIADFMTAITEGNAAQVKQMLSRDPSLAKAVDKDGVTATLKAVYYRRQAVVDLLVSSDNELNIFEASATGYTERIRALALKDPQSVNAYTPDGFFPLGLAAFFGHRDAVEALLRAGADVTLQSRESMHVSALHSALAAGRVDIARLLLDKGANPNARAERGVTPLHEAAARGDIDGARLLVSHGADLNARTDDGRTPLMFAVNGKKDQVASFLRDQGGL